MVSWAEMPRSPGHAFYDKLQEVLIDGGFNEFAEEVCQPFYAKKMGAPRFRPAGISACTSSAISRGSTANAASNGGAATVFHCTTFFASAPRTGSGSFLAVETPTADDLVRMDRQRKDKKLSNKEWVSPVDPDARITEMKDGTTHLAYKPEHAVDLDTGTIVAAGIHAADRGDTSTLSDTLQTAEENLARAGKVPTEEDPAECVGDARTSIVSGRRSLKGYHSRDVLKDLDGGVWKTRIAEPQRKEFSRWHGDEEARKAVYANRNRLRSDIGKETMRRRGEFVERSFAHTLECGGMRRI